MGIQGTKKVAWAFLLVFIATPAHGTTAAVVFEGSNDVIRLEPPSGLANEGALVTVPGFQVDAYTRTGAELETYDLDTIGVIWHDAGSNTIQGSASDGQSAPISQLSFVSEYSQTFDVDVVAITVVSPRNEFGSGFFSLRAGNGAPGDDIFDENGAAVASCLSSALGNPCDTNDVVGIARSRSGQFLFTLDGTDIFLRETDGSFVRFGDAASTGAPSAMLGLDVVSRDFVAQNFVPVPVPGSASQVLALLLGVTGAFIITQRRTHPERVRPAPPT